MTNGNRFDLNSTLALIQSGTLNVPPAPALPADRQTCSDPACVDGFITVDDGDGLYGERVAPCPRCTDRNAKRASHATLTAAGLAGTIYDVSWADLEITHESWLVAQAYAASAGDLIAERQSLIFAGDYGRGKTQAATLILSSAAEEGHHVERVKWGQFVRRIRATYTKESTLTEDALISALVAPDLLLLDDVGAADKHSDHNERLLTSVIDERYDRGRPTILTTNLGREELQEHLGGRAFDRLWNNADVVIFDGPNYRELRERPRARGLASRIRDQVRERQQHAAD